MASFAQLNETNLVTQVLVVNNDALDSSNEEASGIAFLQSIFGEDTVWKQTSYNSSIRFNFAGIGYIYDEIRDAFIEPKSFQSWILNENTCKWEAPTPMPTDGKRYEWDEATLSWVEETI